MTKVMKADSDLPDGVSVQEIRKLSDFAAQARQVILDARQQAARIVSDARAQCEAIKRQAVEQGYNEGFARGHSCGHAEAADKQAVTRVCTKPDGGDVAKLAMVAHATVRQLEVARKQTLQMRSDEVLSFAIQLASKIVGEVAAVDVSAARINLHKVMELVHTDEVTVHVNPSQLEPLRQEFHELIETLGLNENACMLADETVSPGGVRVETARGQYDATIETQLHNVARALIAGDSGQYVSEEGRAGSKSQPQGDYVTA